MTLQIFEEDIDELESRARTILDSRGYCAGSGIRFWLGNDILITEDEAKTLDISLSTQNVGHVYRKSSISPMPIVSMPLVQQTLFILRQIMVLDDLASIYGRSVDRSGYRESQTN